MQFNVDKRFIEILNEDGVSITWEQFRSAYNKRRLEREKEPKRIARQSEAQRELEREILLARAMYQKQLAEFESSQK